MLKKTVITVACAVLLFTVGCVSKGEYQLKVDEADQCAANLGSRTEENSSLKEELSLTQSALMESEGRVEELTVALNDTTSERESIMGALNTQEAVNEELKRQNERLSDLLQSKEISQSQIIQETMDINKKLQGTNAELRENIATKDAEIKQLTQRSQQQERQIADLNRRKQAELAKLKSTYDNLVQGLKSEIEAGEIEIKRMQDRLSVNMVEKILFDSGRADLKESGIEVMRKVGNQLNRVEDKRIQIEGHTDNVPIGGRLMEKYPTNWELSASRALAVVHFLQEDVGIDPSRLSAAGYGEYQPVASNETAEGKAENRRIEIVLLPHYQLSAAAEETTEEQ